MKTIHKINMNTNCNIVKKNVRLNYELRKPQVEENVWRLQEFHCNNKDNCNYFKERKCPNIDSWKNQI